MTERHGRPLGRKTGTARARGLAALSALALLGACSEPLDFDLRGKLNGGFNTADAARAATQPRPRPDERGIISYPSYQVAVARRGDTLARLADRVGLPASELARYNGILPQDSLRDGEIIALPRRVSEPSAATGSITPPARVDITTLAGNAIDSADATPAQRRAPERQAGVEPIRHKVKRGETAFTISRLYNVSPRALAEWNGLDKDFTLREGQFLLIPVVLDGQAPRETAEAAVPPGRGSPTPEPPSASTPLPGETPAAAAAAAAGPEPASKPAADVGKQTEASASKAAMSFPVEGAIIRDYAKGRNDGIDIGAPEGTVVKAAASGQVAAITSNTEGVDILVLRHPDNLLTVYTHIDRIKVKKGDAVSRGQPIAQVMKADPPRVHFEVRKGFDSVDPMTYLK